MEYDHTQYGYTGLLTTVFLVAVMWVSFQSEVDETGWLGLLMASFVIFMAGITFWFSKLTVTVQDAAVTAAFGLGKPHRATRLSDVTGVHQVRTSWIQGWGIRKISNGWMYNVWGLDAVEIELASGGVLLIGTDEPDKLVAAISLSLPG